MGNISSSLGRRWRVTPPHPKTCDLSRELGIPELIAQVLAARGFEEPEAASKFLNPAIEDFHDPRLLPDYRAAADVILAAKDQGHTIYIHGDYDVDGVTSAALFTRFLKRIGCKIIPHVPHRMKEGYGIHHKAVQWAKDEGAHVFLTCDCGISAHEQIEAAREAGMIPVVTDHHELKETLPNAAAVINPHRPDSDYPFDTLSGVGVGLKFCAGLAQEIGAPVDKFYRAFLDLAVMGTVADVMPLINENRIIARHGLPLLRNSAKPGIQALLKVADLDRPGSVLTPRSIGFQLGPRINAVGRIDDSSIALDLLLSDSWDESWRIAQLLDSLNQERRSETSLMQESAGEEILEKTLDADSALVVAKEGWHPGIIGLVASRLVEQYFRPAFVIGVGADGIGKGSARSIPGFHLAEALESAKHLILGGGGHEMAAGFSILKENIESFRLHMAERAKVLLTEEDMVPILELDGEATIATAGPALGEAMTSLEPFGNANEAPLLLARGVTIQNLSPLRSPEHAKMTLTDGSGKVSAIVFGKGLQAAELVGQPIDVAFRPEFNTFRGNTEFRWTVDDLRPAAN